MSVPAALAFHIRYDFPAPPAGYDKPMTTYSYDVLVKTFDMLVSLCVQLDIDCSHFSFLLCSLFV
jgi:hypothetical protein